MLPNLLVCLAVAGVAFFLMRAVQAARTRRAMSSLELTRLEIEEARELERRKPIGARVQDFLAGIGWDGNELTVISALVVLYMVLSAALTLTGLPLAVSALVALPTAGLVVASAARWVANGRRKRFDRQLVELLDRLARQMAAGAGVQASLHTVVPAMPEPLRSEMLTVLNNPEAMKDLPAALEPLQVKYPSRGIRMFHSALEIDRDEGLSIRESLAQAAESLNSEFRLRAEAVAEISQQRGEFFMILTILIGMSAYQLFRTDESTQAAYASPMGLTVLVVAAANVAVGVWRLLRTLSNIEGGNE